MDHSYSARALSPRTLQIIRSSVSTDMLPDASTKLSTGSGRNGSTSRRSPTAEVLQQNVDAILKTAILVEPPEDCVPPRSPVNDENKLDAIQVYGLDFEEDSESSGGSLSQNSPEMYEAGVVPMMEDTYPDEMSLAPKQSSLRRSWINGYQLFTKVNYLRIKQ